MAEKPEELKYPYPIALPPHQYERFKAAGYDMRQFVEVRPPPSTTGAQSPAHSPSGPAAQSDTGDAERGS